MNPLDVLSTFAGFFKNGGPFMYIILLTAVAILGLAMERFWVIARAASVNSGKLTKDLLQRVNKGEISSAATVAQKVRGPVASVAHAILSRSAPDEQTLMNAADGAATIELPRLSRRLPYLSMLANSATLLGLLGTIFGLTTAFSAVGAADPAQRSAFLAVGISQALNTTAFGLIVAVPTLLLHGFLVSKVEAVVEAVDETSVRLIQAVIGKSTRSAGAARSKTMAHLEKQGA
jgi:biopolymer transport protein ExbB/TolQ